MLSAIGESTEVVNRLSCDINNVELLLVVEVVVLVFVNVKVFVVVDKLVMDATKSFLYV